MARSKVLAKTIAALAVLGAVIGGVTGWRHDGRGGVEIRLRDIGQSPLRSVEVTVTGRSYPLGSLPAAATTSVWGEPTSDSGVGVSFTTSTGEVEHVDLGVYIEPGCRSWISADLKGAGAANISDHVEPR